MMAAWLIRYWGDDGPCRKVVAADSKSSALVLADVPAARIVRVTRRWMPSPDGSAAAVFPAPSMKIQMLFLTRALALFTGGSAGMVNSLVTSLPRLKRLARKRVRALRDDLELSAKLRCLGFSPEIVSIIETGEKTGTLTRALETSLAYLKQNTELAQKNAGQLTFGILLLVVSLSLFLIMPLFLSEPIDMLRNLRDVDISLTAATHVLLFVNAAVRDYWWLLCAGGAVVFVSAWKFRHLLTRVPPFSMFGSLEKTRRSICFLVAWRAFRVAGIPLEEQAATLTATLGARASAHVLGRLKNGEALTDTLDGRFFSQTLVLAAPGLAQVGVESFSKIVDVLLVSLNEERQFGAARAATVMYILGAVLTMSTITVLAFGLIFPILGASAGAS